MTRIVLATHNPHKLAEFRTIISDAFPDITIDEYQGPEPVESGLTFAENALIKARAAAEFSGKAALADDSGICVDALSGMPGVFSAYWAGHAKDSDANLDLLLDQLTDIPEPERRSAQFVSVHALVIPGVDGAPAREYVVEGTWPGRLATERHGAGGFGYDPVFVPEGSDRAAAEFSREEKAAVSHRRRAFDALIPVLREALSR